jgi:alkanesulfonate monooxygenase SsuD/methylene tetrahydromethanopterin reductase-like flavin-dependent oxidoreductase (luciferase family)
MAFRFAARRPFNDATRKAEAERILKRAVAYLPSGREETRNAMKLGYFTLTDNPPAYAAMRRDPGQLIRDVVEQCVEAEAMGFSSVWVPEHHFGLFGVLPSPWILLAQVAARTKTVRLGPATVVLPLNHPLRAVEECNLLDQLSNGRAIFSAGRGYDQREYLPFGADFANSRDVFDEQMAYAMAAWRNDPFTFSGRFYSTPSPLSVVPQPLQKPHPEVYVACFSRPSVELAANLGVNTIFAPFAAAMAFGSVQEATAESLRLGREAGNPEPKVMCSYFAFVAHSKKEEVETRERLLTYLRSIVPAFPSDRATAPPHIAYFADIVEALMKLKASDLGERSVVTGDADRCVEILKKCEDAGISEVILYFNFGHFGHRETLLAMERFAKEVMPHFAPVVAPGTQPSGSGIAAS